MRVILNVMGVERGSHRIAVQVLDVHSKVMSKSDPVILYMHRPRVNMGNIPSV